MTIVALIVIGFVAGTLATALGVGGGVVYVPALVVLLSFAQHAAQGTSLAVILPAAVIGTAIHHQHGRVQWPTAITVGLFGIVGALAGSRLALSLDAALLRRMFSILLLLVAARMFIRALRRSTSA